MWVLSRYFSLMVGSKVPANNEKWQNFQRLLEISRYLFAVNIHPDDIGVLDVLITEHHRQFLVLYPTVKVIPKMHFLLHYPRLIMLYVCELDIIV